jgi:hypothetical protein
MRLARSALWATLLASSSRVAVAEGSRPHVLRKTLAEGDSTELDSALGQHTTRKQVERIFQNIATYEGTQDNVKAEETFEEKLSKLKEQDQSDQQAADAKKLHSSVLVLSGVCFVCGAFLVLIGNILGSPKNSDDAELLAAEIMTRGARGEGRGGKEYGAAWKPPGRGSRRRVPSQISVPLQF